MKGEREEAKEIRVTFPWHGLGLRFHITVPLSYSIVWHGGEMSHYTLELLCGNAGTYRWKHLGEIQFVINALWNGFPANAS